MAATRVLSFIDRHLMAILMMGGSLYGGYVTGQAGMKENYHDLDLRVTSLETSRNSRTGAWQCTVRTIDALKDHSNTFPCKLDMPQ